MKGLFKKPAFLIIVALVVVFIIYEIIKKQQAKNALQAIQYNPYLGVNPAVGQSIANTNADIAQANAQAAEVGAVSGAVASIIDSIWGNN